jgi:hypothetical protein
MRVMTTHYASFGVENVIDAPYIKGYILIGFYRDQRTARIAFDSKNNRFHKMNP